MLPVCCCCSLLARCVFCCFVPFRVGLYVRGYNVCSFCCRVFARRQFVEFDIVAGMSCDVVVVVVVGE